MRIAHEIVEKNPDGAVALVGIHRRGAVLAQAAARADQRAARLPRCRSASVDISFYRDDLAIRPSAPIVHATQLDFPVEGRTIVIVDDVLYTGRTVRAGDRRDLRLRPPGAGAARGAGRPRPPRASDPPGLRRQEHPDLGRKRVNVRVEEVDGVDEVTIGPAPEREEGGRMSRTRQAPDLDRRPRPAAGSSGSSTAPSRSPRSPGARSRRSRRCAAGPSSTSSTRRARARARRSSSRPSG